jgi:hypothetical protein
MFDRRVPVVGENGCVTIAALSCGVTQKIIHRLLVAPFVGTRNRVDEARLRRLYRLFVEVFVAQFFRVLREFFREHTGRLGGGIKS